MLDDLGIGGCFVMLQTIAVEVDGATDVVLRAGFPHLHEHLFPRLQYRSPANVFGNFVVSTAAPFHLGFEAFNSRPHKEQRRRRGQRYPPDCSIERHCRHHRSHPHFPLVFRSLGFFSRIRLLSGPPPTGAEPGSGHYDWRKQDLCVKPQSRHPKFREAGIGRSPRCVSCKSIFFNRSRIAWSLCHSSDCEMRFKCLVTRKTGRITGV